MVKGTPLDIIDFTGDLASLVERTCSAFGIGTVSGFSVIEVGYEDCNVKIEAGGQGYVAKIFSKERSEKDIGRYTTIMGKVLAAGVNHPAIKKTRADSIIHRDGPLSMVLMDFIPGKTFFETGQVPNSSERQSLLEQAAKINSIDYKPDYLFDSWAIPNITNIFEKVRQFIQPADLGLVETTVARYSEIPIKQLPHCFVHGDLTKANVLKGNDGKIYVLDFSVSNWYPRIQELAVVAANLMHDSKSTGSLRKNVEMAASDYCKFGTLTAEEKKHLYPFALAGLAMEFLGANQEKYIKGNNNAETDFWLNLGRTGLKKELESELKI